MSSNADAAALQVQEHLKSLNSLVHAIEKERIKGESTLEAIAKVHEAMSHDKQSVTHYQNKLKNLYQEGMKEASQEEELLREALSKIYGIRAICNERRLQASGPRAIRRGTLMKMLQKSAQTLPLWVGRNASERPPPLCGAIPPEPSYIAKPGDMVAALVKVADDDENWILAEVVSYNPLTKKYEVYDIDEDHKPDHTLSRRRVVPLPLMRASPEIDGDIALFPENSEVMALFPQTTCFYRALVIRPPATTTDDYEVVFEDPSYHSGYAPPLKVAQRYVIDIKPDKKKHSS